MNILNAKLKITFSDGKTAYEEVGYCTFSNQNVISLDERVIIPFHSIVKIDILKK